MAYRQDSRCRLCKARVDWRIVAESGNSMMFDDVDQPRGGDPLANFVEYPDPRTGNLVARRLKKGEHLEPDDTLIRAHYRTCPAVVRGGHDR